MAETPTICANIKSKQRPHLRCKNPATHGDYCGLHHKVPRPWISGTPKIKPSDLLKNQEINAVNKIIKWWKLFGNLNIVKRRGIVVFVREYSVNDCDFFSCEKLNQIPLAMFFSYRCDDSHVYGFDIRSIYSLIKSSLLSDRIPENPYNRKEIPSTIIKKIDNLVKTLRRQNINVEWAPITPPTPEQQFRMKVVDVFQTINELNYYSSPDWFINLDLRAHRKFYTELYDIWSFRAGLTLSQKSDIIPGFHTKIFRTAPWAIRDLSFETIAKLNLNTIRYFCTSAEETSNRILGAMYTVTALTIVSTEARNTYPWLYETVEPGGGDNMTNQIHQTNVLGISWLNDLLNSMTVPPLQLPPTQ